MSRKKLKKLMDFGYWQGFASSFNPCSNISGDFFEVQDKNDEMSLEVPNKFIITPPAYWEAVGDYLAFAMDECSSLMDSGEMKFR